MSRQGFLDVSPAVSITVRVGKSAKGTNRQACKDSEWVYSKTGLGIPCRNEKKLEGEGRSDGQTGGEAQVAAPPLSLRFHNHLHRAFESL